MSSRCRPEAEAEEHADAKAVGMAPGTYVTIVTRCRAAEVDVLEPVDRFKAIYEDYPTVAPDRGRVTEADTRANVIDRLLHEVLGWPRLDVKRELHVASGFVDYVLSHGRPLLVIEAKAEGESFHFPFAKSRPRKRTIQTLCGDPILKSHIEQAHRYCTDNGVRYASVTNGYSLVVFRAICEGAAWRAAPAIVYYDLKDIVENFTAFWNLLSHESIRAGALDSHFRQDASRPRHRYRPIDRMVDADAVYGRNPFTSTLRPFVEQFFGDIAKQDTVDVLKHCYVYSRPIQTIDNDLELVLKDQLPQFSGDGIQLRLNESGPAGAFGEELRRVAASPRRGAMVVLMGGIGSGKSTFCRRFFRVVAPELVSREGTAVLFYLDFLGAPDEPISLESFLWRTLAAEIDASTSYSRNRSFLEDVFKSELDVVRNIYSDDVSLASRVSDELFRLQNEPRTYCEGVLSHLASRQRLPIVVFDNVDQLRVEAQTQLYTTAHRVSTSHRSVAIVVLREESYSAALMMRHVTAHTARPYHLSSPQFHELLRMRIDFAVNAARTAGDDVFATDEQRRYAEVVRLFHLLRQSLLGRNKDTIRLVESIAYGNMRLALKLFNSFVTSGATNIPKIIANFDRFRGYTVPFHEFCKSVMLGDYRYYRERRSDIANVFELTASPRASHFTALRILSYLSAVGVGRAAADGFRNLAVLINDCIDVFDNEDDVKSTLLRLVAVDRQLLELDSRRSDSLSGAHAIRITTSGMYYFRVLVSSFSYLDLVWQDTPIGSESLCDELAGAAHETDMIVRFQRVDKFLDYLEAEERDELAALVSGQTSGQVGIWGPFVPRLRYVFEREKTLIRRKLRIGV